MFTYLKPNNFEGENSIEFGFGNQLLDTAYTKENSIFRLEIEHRNDIFKSPVFFILPLTWQPLSNPK